MSVSNTMIIRSFRVRIMLLSVIVSGLVLALFGISGWLLIYSRGIASIDRSIRELGLRELTRRHPKEHWSNLEHALHYIYGKPRGSVILLVQRRAGETLYRSPHWPDDISAADFPPPDRVLEVPHSSESEIPGSPQVNDRHPGRSPLENEQPRWRPSTAGPSRTGAYPLREPPPFAAPPLDGAHPLGWDPPPREPIALTSMPIFLSAKTFVTVNTAMGAWRIGAVGNPEITLLMGESLEDFNDELGRIRNAYLAIMPLALILIAAGGWFIGGRALHPVLMLTRTAESITASGLERRVPSERADAEFAHLISVFNRMLDRLEKSFRQASRFSADAAHELKTPLAIIQGELEAAIQKAPQDSNTQRVFNTLLEESQRLKTITQKLLLLARADAGQLPLTKEPIDFSKMVQDIAEDLDVVAEGLTLDTEIEPDLWTEADNRLMQQVLQNLTSNAVKYNKNDGFIRMALKGWNNQILLSIANSSDDIPAADHERIFERFFRGNPSHNREKDGLGLGLALSREIARAHGGDLVLDESLNGVTRFTLRLILLR